jgi:hypothetical protein
MKCNLIELKLLNKQDMEYEVYYKLNDKTGMYYVSFSQKNLSDKDILYSIKKELIKYLNLTSSEKLEIISINRIR